MRFLFLLAVSLTGLVFAPADEPIPPPRRVPETVLQQREWIAKRAEQWAQVDQLQGGGKRAEAILLGEKIVATDSTILGPVHVLLADSLARLAALYRQHEDYLRAAAHSLRAAVVYAKIHGVDHWLVRHERHWAAFDERAAELTPAQRTRLREAFQTYSRGRALQDQGKYRDAVTQYKACIATFEELLGAEAFPVLIARSELGSCSDALGQYKLARELFERNLAAYQKILGKSHPNYAATLNSLAGVAGAIGDYDAAIKLYEEALAINRRAYGEGNTEPAYNLANLGRVYLRVGDLARAESYLTQAATVFRQHLGAKSPEYATVLSMLGNLYFTRSQYDRAEAAHREALTIFRAWGNGGHPNTPMALNNLASVYAAVGDVFQASRMLDEALAFLRKTVGEKSPNAAVVLSNLAGLYSQAGLRERAIAAYEQSLAIRKELTGEKDPQYTRTLSDLGLAYLRASKPAKAESILRRAAELQKTGAASRHLDYADTLQRLASTLAMQGDFPQTEKIIDQAMKVRAAALGPDHPSLSQDYLLLAQTVAATGEVVAARGHFAHALELEDRELREGFGFTTESAMQLRLMMAYQTLDSFLTFARDNPEDAATQKLAFTWVLRRKAGVLDIQCRYRDLQRLTSTNPDVARQAIQVRRAFDAYMSLLAKPVGADEEAHQTEVTRARVNYTQQQADLHRTIDRVRPPSVTQADDATLTAVRDRLPPGTALVEFAEFTPYDLTAPGKEQPFWKPRRCLAFVLTGAANATPKLIDLGETQAIERDVRAFRNALIRVPREMVFSDEKTLDEEFRAIAAKVSRRVFAPLRPALGSTKRILVAPDGVLNLLSFDALTDNGQYLIESYRFGYISTGRDLLRPKAALGTGTTVFANPDFDWRPDVAPLPAVAGVTDGRLVLRGIDIGELRSLRWKPLRGAAGEAEDIRKALEGSKYAPVKVLVGASARKEAFTAVHGSRVLHIATHGYFLPDRPVEDVDVPLEDADRMGRRPALPPLLRSGLVLTGANRVTDPKAPAAVADEGWLTAEEVALMDLRGTELVVLSACESGLGDVAQAGEGVMGLRRAFQYAGAESVLVTLFKVSDVETRSLMKFFYQRLKDGATPADALHDAKVDLIARRRKEHKAAHPFFWSSFVLVGSKG